MLALCQGLERHYKQVWGKPPSTQLRRGLRVAGWLSLGLSLWFCAQAWGWAMGPVGWFGMLSLSGFSLLMLYTAAFICEEFRAGVSSVRAEQRAAGLALGLRPAQVWQWPKFLRPCVVPCSRCVWARWICVTIMMPHPERVFRAVQNSWRPEEWNEDGAWMRMFRNARVWVN